ncbi:carbohydrate ABC transporter permease [Streptomyces indicus]|uniref:N,N'-diacetylchitobiose transport system permease protein n=1 Tax=Streptomyces indicus TaxID=417292 RepID=A0A1G8UAN0_9ACTN|nr:sugar ABC transporter permease [Streptomyces indicus]SDJ50070.1 N,N'-diacetylchitobiose transport system permease protein [Streptomyces indicus]
MALHTAPRETRDPGQELRRPAAPGRRRSAVLWPYLLIAPTVLGVAFLLLYPLLRNLQLSFQSFGMGELIRGGAEFVGLDNYRELLGGGEFWDVVVRTLVWTVVNVVLIVGLATLVALMLQRLGRTLRVLVMSALALAWATPILAATTVFQWLFASRLGVVNWVLVQLGFDSYEGYSWFADGTATFTILVILVVWQSVPFAAITLYSALTTVPAEIYESARLDGAGEWRMFRSLTVPILRPIFGLVLCLEVIWVFKCFAQIWVVSEGGPNDATTTLPVYAYQIAISLHHYDLQAASSTITVLLLGVILFVYLRQLFRQEGEL